MRNGTNKSEKYNHGNLVISHTPIRVAATTGGRWAVTGYEAATVLFGRAEDAYNFAATGIKNGVAAN